MLDGDGRRLKLNHQSISLSNYFLTTFSLKHWRVQVERRYMVYIKNMTDNHRYTTAPGVLDLLK